MSEILVSVLMPSFNHRKYLRAAIESVWKQSYPNIELIVVDDSSTDGSLDLLKSLKENSPIPMHVYSNEKNCGPSFSLAKAFELSKGDLIAFLASDDIYTPNRFEKQIECFLDTPDMSLTFADGLHLHNDGTLGINVHGNNARSLLNQSASDILNYLYTHTGPFFIQTALVRRALLEGSIDETSIADDWVVNIQMFKKLVGGGKFRFVDQVVFYYRQHDSNIHNNFDRHLALQEQVIERYTPVNLRNEAKANIYWNIGESLIVVNPAKSFRYLYQSQANMFRPLMIIKLVRKIARLTGRKIIRAIGSGLLVRIAYKLQSNKQKKIL